MSSNDYHGKMRMFVKVVFMVVGSSEIVWFAVGINFIDTAGT